MNISKFYKTALSLFASSFLMMQSYAQERYIQDLTNDQWRLILDKAATWKNDKLFAPPSNVKSLPLSIPTGWDMLGKQSGITTKLPATVERFSGARMEIRSACRELFGYFLVHYERQFSCTIAEYDLIDK